MSTVRTIIVDDSSLMRKLIKSALSYDAEIEVVGEASDPYEARELIKACKPDVMTLDIEMPNMNGLEFLEKIMRLRPMPVIMVSTLSKQGAVASIRALEIGAVDCVEKPTPNDPATFNNLANLVKAAGRSVATSTANLRHNIVQQPKPIIETTGTIGEKIIAIGASTGGVEALIGILQQFPADCPPTVITQHMPPMFTNSFAHRLDRLCAAEVREASHDEPLQHGRVYVAPGGACHLTIAGPGQWRCRLVEGEPVNGHCPSVDVMFDSVTNVAGGDAIGVILTGMGRDGAAGLLKMRTAGARTIGQSEESCVVYGMPKAAWSCGAVETQAPLEHIARAILVAKRPQYNKIGVNDARQCEAT